MKVLQINCVYNKGSTGKIMDEIHAQLSREGEQSIICYGRGPKTSDPNVYKSCSEFYAKCNNLLSRFTGLMYGGCVLSTTKLIRIIRREAPDIVHLHCINGYFVNIPRLISFLKKNGIKTVLTLHAEFMHTANCSHAFACDKWLSGCGHCPRLKKETGSLLFDRTHTSYQNMKAAFDGFEHLTVVSVSPWLAERAARSPILAGKDHRVVLNGLDTAIFRRVPDTKALRAEIGVGDSKMIFHATPNFTNDPLHIKGGYYILRTAEELLARGINAKFVIAGDHPKDLVTPDNVILLGRVADQTRLASLYAAADLTVIASKRETFSMVVAESISCGTPVIGFEAGAPEQIAIPQYSQFVEYGNTDALSKAICEALLTPYDKETISKTGAQKYDKAKMVRQYIEIYKERK